MLFILKKRGFGGFLAQNSEDEIANCEERIRHQITEHPGKRGILFITSK